MTTNPASTLRRRTAVLAVTTAALTVCASTSAFAATTVTSHHSTRHGVRTGTGSAAGLTVAADAFGRTMSGALGSADVGGAWTTSGPAGAFSVASGTARFAFAGPGAGADAALRSVSSSDTDLTAGLTLPAAQSGGGTYVGLLGRQVVGSDYQLKLHYYANRQVSATLVQEGSRVQTTLASTPLPGLFYRPGDVLRVRLAVSGTSPTTLSAKVWPAAAAEPASWQVTATDSTPALQQAGGIGISTYLSASSTGAPASVGLSDLLAVAPATTISAGPATGSDSPATTATFAFTASRPGSTFQCQLDAAAWAACTSPTSYAGLVSGPHTFAVRGVDASGNPAIPDSRTWTVDQGSTAITSGPAAGSDSTATSATFAFTTSRDGSTFQCQLDGAAWSACTSPVTFDGLAVGPHTLAVRGVDPSGDPATTDSRSWTVDAVSAPVEPGPTNTGVPAGTVLTPYYGNLTITTPGATYDSLDVHGFVTVDAPNVTITRSIIRGGYGTPGVDVGLVTDYHGANFTITDSELVPEHPSVSLDAIKGWNYTALRINAHGTVDGAKIHGDNVTVQDSWIHDLVTYASDPYQNGGKSHNDGTQILSGTNINIVGNNISGGSNTALLITQDAGAVSGVQITGNWFDGGNQSIALMAKPLPVLNGVTITGNQFGHNTTYHNCAILTWGVVNLVASNNTWEDTGLPVQVRVGG